MKLATNLLQICRKRSTNITQLARASGVPVQTLHGWSTGKQVKNLDQLKKVATVLEISIHELIFGEADPFEPTGQEILKEIFNGDVRITLHRIERKK